MSNKKAKHYIPHSTNVSIENGKGEDAWRDQLLEDQVMLLKKIEHQLSLITGEDLNNDDDYNEETR